MISESGGYKVSIKHYEGPLDLLLHLIGKAKIDIEQIFVSDVTNQYLEYVASIPDFSMEHASEFLEMAATLLFIKSRMILPDCNIADETEDDPQQELIGRLKAYKAYKEAAQKLKTKEQNALNIYYKLPEEVQIPNERWEIEELTLQILYESYLEVLQRRPSCEYERIEEVSVQKDVYTIKERAHYILRALTKMGSASFFSLFDGVCSRLEIAVTFAALLELLHKSAITICQEESFEDIIIIKNNKESAV